jgi:hypothetical protein
MKISESSVSSEKPTGLLKAALFIGILLLPIDHFEPTASAFREAGAKPSILAFAFAAIVSFFQRSSKRRIMSTQGLNLLWLMLLCCGVFAFLINLFMSWPGFEYTKDPLMQFLSQLFLLSLFAAVTIQLSIVFRSEITRRFVFRLFLPVALFHLAFYFLEESQILSDNVGTFLGLFRVEGGIIERSTGLMSEPSYFGVFAGMFSLIVLLDSSRNLLFRIGIPIVLITLAISINAKTIMVVLGMQMLGLYWLFRSHKYFIFYVLITLPLFVAGYTYVNSLATFNLQENMSTTMRIGSTLLGLNLALDGNGILGVGIGQFHFYYNEYYAPDFLLLSEEALTRMDPSSTSRASVYNFFVRFLVEGGVASLLIICYLILRGARNALNSGDAYAKRVYLLILSSVGFLLTQDTYFYPPLCLGLAMAYSLGSNQLDAFSDTRLLKT